MKVKSVKDRLPSKFYDTFTFDTFRPSQSKAIKAGLLDGKSVVVCSPTASGKTFIAELAGIKRLLEDGGKMVYIVPLKSLASEKADEFKDKYEKLGIRTALSIGDPDSSEGWLAKYDIIVCTSEKFDSLMRHKIPWLRDVKTVVVDEIPAQPILGVSLDRQRSDIVVKRAAAFNVSLILTVVRLAVGKPSNIFVPVPGPIVLRNTVRIDRR